MCSLDLHLSVRCQLFVSGCFVSLLGSCYSDIILNLWRYLKALFFNVIANTFITDLRRRVGMFFVLEGTDNDVGRH